jgi:hypothetical protein
MSPFAGYLLGLLILVVGLAVAAYLLNVPTAAVAVAVIVAVVLIGAWATRRPRARPSKFTGATPNAPTLDRTVLMELKTMLMDRVDAARNQPTTRMPRADDARSQPTTRIQPPTGVSKGKPVPPRDED